MAKTSFIRLQAANDAKDLDDIRDFTTPELYAEIAMQAGERGEAAQKTEVVTLNASLVEAVVEGDYAIVSVRFTGLIREQSEAQPGALRRDLARAQGPARPQGDLAHRGDPAGGLKRTERPHG